MSEQRTGLRLEVTNACRDIAMLIVRLPGYGIVARVACVNRGAATQVSQY